MNNEFETIGDIVKIKINSRMYDEVIALIESKDLVLVNNIQGKLTQFYHRTDKLYVMCNSNETGKRKQILLHNLILKPTPGNYIAFRDGDTLNCCRNNLIEVPKGIDLKKWIQSESSLKLDRVTGITWNTRDRKWDVRGRCKGKSVYLGSYKAEDKEMAEFMAMEFKELGLSGFYKRYKLSSDERVE
jgi:hypothetical protein